MASPDFREYVDLTINDVQPLDIYNASIEYAKVALPEFAPRSGTVEDAMLQAMSYVAGLMTGAINRLPNGLMEGILRLMGFDRDEETFATGSIVLTTIDDTGVTIPAGFQVSYTEVTDTETIQHVFETSESAQILLGQTVSGPIPVVAVEAGEKPVISDGDTLLILSASNKVLGCTFSGTLSQGIAGESDDSYFARGATYLSSLSSCLTTAPQMDKYVLNAFRDVFRSNTYDLTGQQELDGIRIFMSGSQIAASLNQDPTLIVPTPTAGDHVRIYGVTPDKFNRVFSIASLGSAGSNTIFFSNIVGASAGETYTLPYKVELLSNYGLTEPDNLGNVVTFLCDSEGAAISSGLRTTIKNDLLNRVVAGLTYNTSNALIADFNLNITIAVANGFAALDVRSAVDAAITAFLSPQSWDWSPIVRRNAIITRVSQVPGVSYIDDLTISLPSNQYLCVINTDGDVEFNYKGVLPRATVTVGSI